MIDVEKYKEAKMEILDFFGKNFDAKKGLVEIGKAISADDKVVAAEIEKCVKDTEAYFEENEERFEERGMEQEDMEEDAEEVRWIALVDILEVNGYVCERDWKDELEDFVQFVGNLKGTKSRELPIELEWFDEDGDAAEWCKVLDEKWADKGVCVAAIDIESDSYVLFPYEVEELGKLCELAEALERRIDMAKNV